MSWNQRNQADPAHRWFRERIKQFFESHIMKWDLILTGNNLKTG